MHALNQLIFSTKFLFVLNVHIIKIVFRHKRYKCMVTMPHMYCPVCKNNLQYVLHSLYFSLIHFMSSSFGCLNARTQNYSAYQKYVEWMQLHYLVVYTIYIINRILLSSLIMNVWIIFSPYHKHCSHTDTYTSTHAHTHTTQMHTHIFTHKHVQYKYMLGSTSRSCALATMYLL